MSTLDTLIEINITNQTAPVPTASFSIPLIIGPTVPTTGGIIQAYTDPKGLLSNGYTTASPEYIKAQELMEQAISPSEFFVGQRLAAVTQIDTFSVNTLAFGHVYEFEIGSNLISYTSVGGDTQEDILGHLATQVLAIVPAVAASAVVSGAGAGALLTITSIEPGLGISYSLIDADLTHAVVAANHGIADDLLAMLQINNTPYGIILCSNADSDIMQLAAAVEPLVKMFFPISSDAAIATSATTDLLSLLKGHNYKRTALMYSLNNADGKEAAWVGGQLPATPGSNDWAYKQLSGISADAISDGARSIIIGDPVAQIPGKNGNIYSTVGGYDITQMGVTVSGQYIDITIGLDWLKATLQSNIMQARVNASKIPYTDRGVGILISAVQAAINQGVSNGLIDGNSPISVTAPPVLSVPSSQRANRVAPTISFSCRLQGAISSVVVDGTVTV